MIEPKMTPSQSNKAILRAMFQEVFTSPVYNEETVRKYFSPQYSQTVDGKTLDFTQFCQHVQVQKQATKSITIHFKALAEEGDFVFSHHIAKAELCDHRTVKFQIFAEFRFQDGKLIACNELTRMLCGNPDDRDLGSKY
jgi:hypothetical protein